MSCCRRDLSPPPRSAREAWAEHLMYGGSIGTPFEVSVRRPSAANAAGTEPTRGIFGTNSKPTLISKDGKRHLVKELRYTNVEKKDTNPNSKRFVMVVVVVTDSGEFQVHVDVSPSASAGFAARVLPSLKTMKFTMNKQSIQTLQRQTPPSVSGVGVTNFESLHTAVLRALAEHAGTTLG